MGILEKVFVSETASIIVLGPVRCEMALESYREAKPTSQRPGNQ